MSIANVLKASFAGISCSPLSNWRRARYPVTVNSPHGSSTLLVRTNTRSNHWARSDSNENPAILL